MFAACPLKRNPAKKKNVVRSLRAWGQGPSAVGKPSSSQPRASRSGDQAAPGHVGSILRGTKEKEKQKCARLLHLGAL